MAGGHGGRRRRRLPGWLVTSGWVLLGVSAAGLPVALAVAALDVVRREGSSFAQGVVVAGLVLAAVGLVVALERGLVHAAAQGWSATAIAGALAGVVAVVLAGVLLPGFGLVLAALVAVLALVGAPAGLGLLVWWRWRTGPTGPVVDRPSTAEVRARAEERRAAVRARHDATRAAVAAGLIGPGFRRPDAVGTRDRDRAGGRPPGTGP